MGSSAFLDNLIMRERAAEHLLFRAEPYPEGNFTVLLLDIMAMANSRIKGRKYIITGVRDEPTGNRAVIGASSSLDQTRYRQVVTEYIAPQINLNYFVYECHGKPVEIFELLENDERPYMLKQDLPGQPKGCCLIRKGNHNYPAALEDFAWFFGAKEKIAVRILTPVLAATKVRESCAVLPAAIRNLTGYAVEITYGELRVKDRAANSLTRHRLYGVGEFAGDDFRLALPPGGEAAGDLYLNFSSDDCLRLGLDTSGVTDRTFTFELRLFDAQDKEYRVVEPAGRVFAEGDFLWKVKYRQAEAEKERKLTWDIWRR